MIEGYSPVIQSLLGTLFTWGLTAAGSALVFVFATGQVMLAASYWSLLAPAIEMSSQYGRFAFLPAAVGFSFGAGFVYFADKLLPALGLSDDPFSFTTLNNDSKPVKEKEEDRDLTIRIDKIENGDVYQRKRGAHSPLAEDPSSLSTRDSPHKEVGSSWRRIMLLILAITIHNIPEGLAVGVGFGAIGKTASATFESARNLAVGIGIQNFPEGLAVSLPLRGAGVSTWKAFWYGQLSGMVEPIAGVLGAVAISLAEPLLPYALAFAAGAMVYVVMDDIIPEAQTGGNGKLASWTCILGFVVMMSLDVGLS
ncbi:zinc transporter ZIP11 isoform X4 [Ranitomeya imitator]|uniref:zinc transporter ZIP11 isoform X4 n=1 Tax=Ranitomeya imitator TaxID=111125 RepID=UPI0037E80872